MAPTRDMMHDKAKPLAHTFRYFISGGWCFLPGSVSPAYLALLELFLAGKPGQLFRGDVNGNRIGQRLHESHQILFFPWGEM
jgi:hypothetical protein